MPLSSVSLHKTSLTFLILLVLSSLQACGIPDERGGTTGSTSDAQEEQSELDTDITLGKTVIVNVERLNGSTDLSLNNVSVVALNSNFQESGDGKLPQWQVQRSEDTNNVEIFLETDYTEHLNHVIKISFADDEYYYAAFPYVPAEINTTASVTANIFSHYLLKKLFDLIPDSDALISHQPCTESDPVVGCANQPRAKQDYLAMLGKMASEFNQQLASNQTIGGALALIDQQEEIRSHVEAAVNEITREQSPFAKGTVRDTSSTQFNSNGEVLSLPQPWNKSYNSVFYALSLSDIEPDNDVDSVLLASSNSTIVGNKELANELPAYPGYFQNTFLAELRRDSLLFIDVPYERTTLTIKDIDNITLDRSEPINAYASSSTLDSFLSREGNLLEGRVLSQTIPGSIADAKDIGWQYEPLFAKLYQANEVEPDNLVSAGTDNSDLDYGAEPTWLTGASYSKANSFQLSPEDEREKRLEEIELFSWEIHSLQTPTTFSASVIDGKQFGVLSFANKMDDGDTMIELFAESMIWTAGTGVFSLSQPSANEHYRSHTLTRNTDNSVQALTEKTNIIENTRTYFSEQTEIADASASSGTSFIDLGLLKLDGGSEAPIGHSTENGSYLAFSFNTSDTSSATDRGTGIIIAMELEDIVSPNFPDLGDESQFVYQLQGNSVSIQGDTNTLQNLNGSTLKINDRLSTDTNSDIDCHAVLNLSRLYVSHILNDDQNSISSPQSGSQSNLNSSSCRIDRNEIEIGYDEVFGQALTLKGFISASGDGTSKDIPGNLLSLLWLQENTVGLVQAGLEQSLDANFE